MDLDKALDKLKVNNLKPKSLVLDGEIQIRGAVEEKFVNGRSITTAVYIICLQADLWTAAIPVAHPFPIIARSNNLDAVVDAVCSFYKLRETTAPDNMGIEEASILLGEAGLILTGLHEDEIRGFKPIASETLENDRSESFGILRHAGAWMAIRSSPDNSKYVLKYSKALSDVTRAVIDYFSTASA